MFYSKIEKKESFAIETNLCDLETYKSFIGVQGLGYEVNIFFLCVDCVAICIGRVNQRVSQGGHNVNPDVILSRYTIGQKRLGHYKDFPDRLVLMDNSLGSLHKQAEFHKGNIYFKSDQLSEWVKNIITDATPQQGKPTSIEEARKRYKGEI